jgi:hypothetical protein
MSMVTSFRPAKGSQPKISSSILLQHLTLQMRRRQKRSLNFAPSMATTSQNSTSILRSGQIRTYRSLEIPCAILISSQQGSTHKQHIASVIMSPNTVWCPTLRRSGSCIRRLSSPSTAMTSYTSGCRTSTKNMMPSTFFSSSFAKTSTTSPLNTQGKYGIRRNTPGKLSPDSPYQSKTPSIMLLRTSGRIG